MNYSLTNNIYIDIIILSKLDNKSFNICKRLNKYINKLYCSNNLWRFKTYNKYGDKIANDKLVGEWKNKSWKEWYYRLDTIILSESCKLQYFISNGYEDMNTIPTVHCGKYTLLLRDTYIRDHTRITSSLKSSFDMTDDELKDARQQLGSPDYILDIIINGCVFQYELPDFFEMIYDHCDIIDQRKGQKSNNNLKRKQNFCEVDISSYADMSNNTSRWEQFISSLTNRDKHFIWPRTQQIYTRIEPDYIQLGMGKDHINTIYKNGDIDFRKAFLKLMLSVQDGLIRIARVIS